MELYNCSAKTEDEWYIEGTANKPLGIYFLISGIILEMIYIPCLIVMLKKDLIRNSCYKIMLILGISDICCIFVNSVITGYLTFNGAVYCTHPNLIFISGSIGMSCWCCCCLTCVILALNRCFDLSEKRVLHYLFEGNKVCFIQAAPIVYCLFFVGFTQPVLFNSKYSAWFFDPFIGLESSLYTNFPHTINNCIVALGTTPLYAYLCTITYRLCKTSSGIYSNVQKEIVLQASLICFSNAIAAYIYVFMQFFSTPNWVVLFGQLCWQNSSGCVCLIYVTVNKTIRKGVLELICHKRVANVFFPPGVMKTSLTSTQQQIQRTRKA